MDTSNGESTPPKQRKKPGRVPVSCAECRRLKLRCDRRHPCDQCTKRGCAAICPDGQLTTGKHKRMFLANTEELHERITYLHRRVRDLEAALRTLQEQVSTHPHPLLAPELLLPPPTESPYAEIGISRSRTSGDGESFLDTHGTLTIGTCGETSFLGQTARSDYLLDDDDSDSDDGNTIGRLPRDFRCLTWPESPPPVEMQDERVLGFLPSLQEAYDLCRVYLEYGAWLGLFVTRDQLYHDFVAHVYHIPNSPWEHEAYTDPHRTSLLFSIFAVAALLDPKRTNCNPEAEDFYQLSKVALAFKSPVQETTVNAVLSIMHMAMYLEHCDSPQAHEQSWMILGVATKLAFSMGLHRDSSRWRLEPTIASHRQTAFWQLYIMEIMASLHFGRPPLLSDAFIDCPPITNDSDDNVTQRFHTWLIKFARLARRVSEEAFGVRAPSYNAIVALDAQIRSFENPVNRESTDEIDFDDSPVLRMQQWCSTQLSETLLLQLHRSFFVQAISDHPEDALKGRYAPSVRACFSSAVRLLDELVWAHKKIPDIIVRVGGWFSSTLSSAIVMCLLVTRCPKSELAPIAMDQLNKATTLLHSAPKSSRRVQRDLAATERLRAQAHEELSHFRLGLGNERQASSPHQNPPRHLSGRSFLESSPREVQSRSSRSRSAETDGEKTTDLEQLGGRTRLVARRPRTPNPNGGRGLTTGHECVVTSRPDAQAQEQSRRPTMATTSEGWNDVSGSGSGWINAWDVGNSFFPSTGQLPDASWSFTHQLGF